MLHETQTMKLLAKRIALLQEKCVGGTCRVELIDKGKCPYKLGFEGIYVPLPEYGVALWFDATDLPCMESEPGTPITGDSVGEWP
jgi:hypothetical protein